MIDAIAWKFQSGSQWVHLPEKYGNWRGVYNRLRMWAVDGTCERVFTALMAQADADEDLNWAVGWLRRSRVLLPGVCVLARQVSEVRKFADKRLRATVAGLPAARTPRCRVTWWRL